MTTPSTSITGAGALIGGTVDEARRAASDAEFLEQHGERGTSSRITETMLCTTVEVVASPTARVSRPTCMPMRQPTTEIDSANTGVLTSPAQTCCTGLGYYSDLIPPSTMVGIAARNACVVVDDEHPVMSYLCPTCYPINKKARDILDVDAYREQTNDVLDKVGRRYHERTWRIVSTRFRIGDEIMRCNRDETRKTIRRAAAAMARAMYTEK